MTVFDGMHYGKFRKESYELIKGIVKDTTA